jgi:hypothetical protein
MVPRLGNPQRRQGESRKARIDDRRHRKLRPGEGIAIPPIQHHPPFANPVCCAAQQPPQLPRDKQPDIHERRPGMSRVIAN